MALQTSYSLSSGPLQEGCLARGGPRQIDTGANDSGVAIPFGRVVVFDSAGGQADSVKLPSAAGQKIKGLAIFTHLQVSGACAAGEKLELVKQGVVAMKVTTAVTPASPVYVRYTVGSGGEAVGTVGATSDSGKNEVLAGAQFLTSASSGGIALLEINIPA